MEKLINELESIAKEISLLSNTKQPLLIKPYGKLENVINRLKSNEIQQSELTMALANLKEERVGMIKMRNTVNKYLREHDLSEEIKARRRIQIAEINEELGLIKEQISYLHTVEKKSIDQKFIELVLQKLGKEEFQALHKQATQICKNGGSK